VINKLDEEICDWCNVNIDLWHGEHAANCPHELLEFVGLHICHGDETGYQVCTPCSKYMELKITSESINYTVAESWRSPRFHTDFCREMRMFLDRQTKKNEVLPKLQKAPKPESET